MERFRAHEKVFKTKKFSTKGLQRGDSMDNDNDDDSDYGDEGDMGDDEPQNEVDKKWLKDYVESAIKPYITKLEGELEASKNKKIKGTTSQKHKERKEKELNYKLT